jgi:hypothetical protein
MNDKTYDSPGAAAGVPQSDPPDPDDDDKLRPADLTPGFGGTSDTKPAPTDKSADEPADDA